MISNHVPRFFLGTLPLLLIASCTNQPTQSTVDKKAELCTNLARFKTSVATLKSMSPSSTVGDFRTAQDQVKANFNEVKTSAQAVQEAKSADLERAYQDLEQTVRAIPNTATLNQASESVAPKIAAVEAAETQMSSGLNCP
jgi:inhibitor of KinA sporulation pathway (predicted exonuclease)